MIMNLSNASELVTLLNGLTPSTISEGSNGADVVAVKYALFAALRRLQTPFDTAMDVCWNNVAAESATRTLVNVGLFEKWVAQGGKPATGRELATMTGVELELMGVSRLCNYLCHL